MDLRQALEMAQRTALDSRDLCDVKDLTGTLLLLMREPAPNSLQNPPQIAVNERIVAVLEDLHRRVVALERVNALALRQSAEHRAAALERLRT